MIHLPGNRDFQAVRGHKTVGGWHDVCLISPIDRANEEILKWKAC